MLGFWVLGLLFALLLATIPVWPYSRAWGFAPGGFALALIALWSALIWFGFVVFAWPWRAEAAL